MSVVLDSLPCYLLAVIVCRTTSQAHGCRMLCNLLPQDGSYLPSQASLLLRIAQHVIVANEQRLSCSFVFTGLLGMAVDCAFKLAATGEADASKQVGGLATLWCTEGNNWWWIASGSGTCCSCLPNVRSGLLHRLPN